MVKISRKHQKFEPIFIELVNPDDLKNMLEILDVASDRNAIDAQAASMADDLYAKLEKME